MRWLWIIAVGLWAGAALRDGFDDWIAATVLPPLVVETGVEVLDRDGRLLRAYTVADGRWRMRVGLEAVDTAYVTMLLRYEDKRFYQHRGVDTLALLRSAAQAVRSGRVVSGGSTLTMQVARLLEEGGTGHWSGKLRQIRVALALERQLSKEAILTLYLNRAPFGGNIEGVRAAALAWFGKPPRRLTDAEAALLVALPQSPETRRPDRHAKAAAAARDRVLARMAQAGVLSDEALAAALRRDVDARRFPFPMLAPHLADRARTNDALAATHRLTLDADIQQSLSTLAREAVARRDDRVQIAIVAADHTTGEILASVGSAAYAADGRAGFLDLTQAVRSPGSTLKPLVYGIGFDRGLIHPETMIADRPTDFDGYRPQNFDGFFRGELRVRDALQQSLNIPVVSVTQAIGPHHLVSGLRRAGVTPEIPGEVPGLAISLGGVGVTLTDLVGLYGALANGGHGKPLHWTGAPAPGRRVISDVAAWQVADILLGVPAPAGVTGRGIAYKTGTSYGHRDAWAIGFDGRHVIGVWMGRADGTPVPGAFGGELAAPVMFRAFARIKDRIDPLPPPPPATLLLATSDLPLPLQRFRPPGEIIASDGPRIIFPPDGAEIAGQVITVKVRHGRAPFTYLANGHRIAVSQARTLDIDDLGAGFSDLTVIDADGLSARIAVALRP